MSAVATVRDFLQTWDQKSGFEIGVRQYLTPDCDYENVGLSRTTGPEEAIGFINAFKQQMPFERITITDMLIVADGDTVMTERTDHFWSADGKLIASVRLMGVFVVRNGQISAWRDYFDPTPLKG